MSQESEQYKKRLKFFKEDLFKKENIVINGCAPKTNSTSISSSVNSSLSESRILTNIQLTKVMPPKNRKLNLKTQTKTKKHSPLFPTLPMNLVSVICDFDKSIKKILKESADKHKKTPNVEFSFPRFPSGLNLPSTEFSLPDEFSQLIQHKENESNYKKSLDSSENNMALILHKSLSPKTNRGTINGDVIVSEQSDEPYPLTKKMKALRNLSSNHDVSPPPAQSPTATALVPLSQSHDGGIVLAAYCAHRVVAKVQEYMVSFHTLQGLRLANLPRRTPSRGHRLASDLQGIRTDRTIFVIYFEFWRVYDAPTDLLSIMYIYNANLCTSNIIELDLDFKYRKGLKFCLIETALILSYFNESTHETIFEKYLLENDFRRWNRCITISAVESWIDSLHCIQDCNYILLGFAGNEAFIWNLITGRLLNRFNLCGADFRALLWARQDHGVLFLIMDLKECLQLIAVNLSSGKWKKINSYNKPDTSSQISKVFVEETFLLAEDKSQQGFVSWELSTGLLLLSATRDHASEIYLSSRYVLIIKPDWSIQTLDALELIRTKVQ